MCCCSCFLSGWFLPARQYDTPGALLFWKRHLPGLVLTAEIWLVLYAVFDAVRPGGIAFSAGRLVRNMTFQEYTQGHMWYMPMILGLYLFVLFVACAVQRLGLRAFAVPVCVAGFFFLCSRPRTWCCWRWAVRRWAVCSRWILAAALRPAAGRRLSDPARVPAPRAHRLAGAGRHCVLCRAGWLEFFACAARRGVQCALQLLSSGGVGAVPVRAFEPRAARASRQAGGKPCCCSFGIYLVHVPVQTLLKPVAAGIAVMPLRIVVYVALLLAVGAGVFSWKIPALGRELFYLR